METWQKFMPPQGTIWGMGIVSPVALWGLASPNCYIFYGSSLYLGILLFLSVWIKVLKITKRKNDVKVEYARQKLTLEREAINNSLHMQDVKMRDLQIDTQSKLANHYLEILQVTKPTRGDLSTYFVSEVESHALEVITAKLQSLSNPEIPEAKLKKLVPLKQVPTHEEL